MPIDPLTASWPAATGPVDVHTHAISPLLPDLRNDHAGSWPSVERIAEDRARILLDGRPYREVDDRCWSAVRRLRDMDDEGVAGQVISPMPITLCHAEPADGAAALARAQNGFLAGLVAHAPDRLAALGAVPLQDPERAVAELAHCMDDLGFLGVEIGTRAGDVELSDSRLDPFFDAAADRRALVLVHPVDVTLDPRMAALDIGFGLGMPSETAVAAAALLTGPARRPGVRLCLAHGGGALPSVLPRLDRGEVLAGRAGTDGHRMPGDRARDLWCDSLTYDAHSLHLAAERFGCDHVLLGTDYPFAAREYPPGAVLADVDDALRAAVSRDNFRALLAGWTPAG